MRLLRDVREGTKTLLLLEMTRRRHTRLKGLAEKLDLTVAGVSEYVKSMEKEGLLQRAGGELRATKKGVEFLQGHVLALRDFVESSVGDIAIIDEAVAVAGEALREGDPVGLFMEMGTLVARQRPSPSSGTTAFRATKGEVVLVRNLEGIVELRPGRIAIARLPALRHRRKRPTVDACRRLVRRMKPNLVAALDVQAKALAAKVGVKGTVEFSPVAASIEAAQRGLRVLLLCPEERVGEVVAAIEAANERTEDKIPYETVNLG